MRYLLVLILFLGVSAAAAEPPSAPPFDPENTVYLDLDYGRVIIALRPDLAPRHVARLKHLIRGGYYDGMVFYRVVPGFAAQTGDFKGDGTGPGTGRTLNAEFTRTPQVRGTVSMARTSKRNSADAEWFIVLADAPDVHSSLDGKYTVWGEVTSGMEFVDQIPKGDPKKDGRGIAAPAHIVKMRIAADADAPGKLPFAALLQRSDVKESAQNFAAMEFKCAGLVDGAGITTQSALAHLWTNAFLIGAFAAKAASDLKDEAPAEDAALTEACAGHGTAFLLAAGRELAKTPRAMPAGALLMQTCRAFADTLKPSDKALPDLNGLWAFAYIQGYKSVSQPDKDIPWTAKPKLLDAFTKTCAKFPDRLFLDIAAAVGAKVRIE
jgi:cyclophilin family peptidyl-prolyl cis-trans isomerase